MNEEYETKDGATMFKESGNFFDKSPDKNIKFK
jgi:hypothetical protein